MGIANYVERVEVEVTFCHFSQKWWWEEYPAGYGVHGANGPFDTQEEAIDDAEDEFIYIKIA